MFRTYVFIQNSEINIIIVSNSKAHCFHQDENDCQCYLLFPVLGLVGEKVNILELPRIIRF